MWRDILLVGFVGSDGYLADLVDLDKEFQNLKYVIYEIKKDCLFGRNMKKQFDWILIKDVDDIKDEITSIKNSINEKYDELKKDIHELKKDINEIKDLLGKKRKRGTKKIRRRI